ncbi:hypothetical protein [Corynebacterium silvaticum]|uniref:hypothetical protein n=1 Tax=Corynebacterium silvaticum TaxID=2320431 RepID=UPI001CED8715|nr:hypothetical protein [Corynebacterium silvaticum]UWG99612.1 hypothetical protein K1I39_07620 [Corynebacterium silvaticum]UWH01658.1 hypothetical protein K1I38_07635 [Corynebacterium silvaticum]
MSGEPFLELDRRVRVVEPRELLRASQRGYAVLPIALHRTIDQRLVEADAGVVDALVKRVGVPFGHGEREVGQPVMDRQFDLDVAAVIGDELFPPVWVGCRQVTHPALIEDTGCGRGAKNG